MFPAIRHRQLRLPLGLSRHLCLLVSTGPMRVGDRFVRQVALAVKLVRPAGESRTVSLVLHHG